MACKYSVGYFYLKVNRGICFIFNIFQAGNLSPLISLDSLSIENAQKSVIEENKKCDTTFSEPVKQTLSFQTVECSLWSTDMWGALGSGSRCMHARVCAQSLLPVVSNSYHPMDCSPPGSSVHGISQARILERVAMSFSSDIPNPGIEPESPAWQANCLPLSHLRTPSKP